MGVYFESENKKHGVTRVKAVAGGRDAAHGEVGGGRIAQATLLCYQRTTDSSFSISNATYGVWFYRSLGSGMFVCSALFGWY